MSLKTGINPRHQWVHWMVLACLVLGQLALGLGAARAHESHLGGAPLAICTSSGIQYIELLPDADLDRGGVADTAASGSCFFCTVSPRQLRFDLHDIWRVKPQNTGLYTRLDRGEPQALRNDFLAQHPAPRAPPLG